MIASSASLPAFPHVVGTHCSSTSVADVLRFDGTPLSEAMVFGLGSGLGFFYVDDPRYSPTRRFNGRANDLEGKFYRLAGAPLDWAGTWQPGRIAEALAAGRPVLAQTDIAYLPYYEPAHFPLHGVVVTAIDGETETVRLADTASPELLEVPWPAFRAALVGEHCPLMQPYRFAAAPLVSAPADAGHIAQALAVTAEEMLYPPEPHFGLPALTRLARAFATWAEVPDWAWCARFAYQGIEKRGTGGGAFRFMYADFLDEVTPVLPALAGSAAAARCRASGRLWQALASECKRVFVEQDRAGFAGCGRVTAEIAALEATLMTDLAELAVRFHGRTS